MMAVTAYAPGRVNLIGEHTDYAGGLALPMAIDLGTTVTGVRAAGPGPVTLRSSLEPRPAVVGPGVTDPARVSPAWARYVAGVVAQLGGDAAGFDGTVTTTLPVGAGLSSSAALGLAVALALGFDGPPRRLAELAQRAEHAATGVPSGLLDQLAGALGRAGHALLIDFTAGTAEPVAVPDHARFVVVHSGERRAVEDSPYTARVAACEAAAARIGPLAAATAADVASIPEPVLRRRARHVVTENGRVREMAAALRAGDLVAAGAAMDASQASLRDDHEVSTPALDALVADLRSRPGVHGARLTGAGFGGCVVALAEPGALVRDGRVPGHRDAWAVTASDGARVHPLPG